MTRMTQMTLTVLLALALVQTASAQYGYPRQTVYDSGYTYTLYTSGNITRSGGWGTQLIDNGTGSQMIAAGGGRLYNLKNNGNIWMYDGSWHMIDNGTGTNQIWVQGGQVYCRKNNGQTWVCVNPYQPQWQPVGGYGPYDREANFNRLYGETSH